MITGTLAELVERLVADRQPFVEATVVRAVRPTSAQPGDKAVVLADGTMEGFVGGTCAQSSVRLHAAQALQSGEAVLLRLVPGAVPADGAPDAEDGIVVAHNPCLSGGTLDVFLQPQLPPRRIVVAGDTPIARAVEQVARAAGYDAVRGAGEAIVPRPGDAAVIVASHGTGEEVALVRALEAGVGYVGLVAGKVRGAAIRESLDVPAPLRDRIHTPAGLDIGARAPAEIAIAILAELVAEQVAAPALPAAGVLDVIPAAPATATDPICGMEVVAVESTPHLDAGGERVYFCCEGCRETYAAREAERVAAP